MKDNEIITRREFFKTLSEFWIESFRSLTKKNVSFSLKTSTKADHNKGEDLKVASINVDDCLAWAGGSCQACYLSCPRRDQAIFLEEHKPIILSLFCDGCAKCILACQTVNDVPAISLTVVERQKVKLSNTT